MFWCCAALSFRRRLSSSSSRFSLSQTLAFSLSLSACPRHRRAISKRRRRSITVRVMMRRMFFFVSLSTRLSPRRRQRPPSLSPPPPSVHARAPAGPPASPAPIHSGHQTPRAPGARPLFPSCPLNFFFWPPSPMRARRGVAAAACARERAKNVRGAGKKEGARARGACVCGRAGWGGAAMRAVGRRRRRSGEGVMRAALRGGGVRMARCVVERGRGRREVLSSPPCFSLARALQCRASGPCPRRGCDLAPLGRRAHLPLGPRRVRGSAAERVRAHGEEKGRLLSFSLAARAPQETPTPPRGWPASCVWVSA